MKITGNTGTAKMYWGASPYPAGSECLGVIYRTDTDMGALILMSTGLYVQGNAGSIKTLDQQQVRELLRQIAG